MSHALKFAPLTAGLSLRAPRGAAGQHLATRDSRGGASVASVRPHDSPDEMAGDSTIADARRRERARCAAIFACKAAAGNIALAAHLAFNTTLSRRDAIAALKAVSASAAPPRRIGRRELVQASWDAAHARNLPRNQRPGNAPAPAIGSRPSPTTTAWDRAHAANAPRTPGVARKR